MASTYLTKTFSSAGNRKTWTMSAWIKRTALASSSDIRVWGWKSGGGNYGFQFDSDAFRFYLVAGGSGSEFLTNRKFRDTNAWYHIVAKCDTTQATQSERFKLYINGVQETSFSTATYPNQNEDTAINQAEVCRLGCNVVATNSFFDGLMSHVHFTDGYAYDASTFGSTDSTTGEWNINTSPSVTYGTNGFFLLKDDNAVTDRSGQGNNFTLGGGTFTKTEDNPSNVFDTINTNFAKTGGVNGRDSNIRVFIDNGATRLSTDVALWTTMLGSIPMFSGKYYWECKRTFEGSPSNHLAYVGIEPLDTAGTTLGSPVGTNTNAIAYYTAGSVNKSNSSQSGTWASWQSNNDIAQVAVDLDNYFIYFGKNGTWQNSGDPTSGSSGTGGIAIMAGKGYVNGFTTHRGGGSAGGDKSMLKMNFGNGYFQTTAVASAGTNASNLGIFEYDVPTGYTALCTKGLNE